MQLGAGLYSVVEAARLLKTPRRTLGRWVDGYVLQLRGGDKSYAPVIDRDGNSPLTFGDLIELMYVRGFRDIGVDLDDIGQAAARFRSAWQTPYPLATERFAADAGRLLVDQGGIWQDALSGQGKAFLDELSKQLVHAGDLTTEWRPLGTDHAVVLNPNRAFGKPIEDTSGAHTFVLATALEGEQDPASVAWWYGTTTQGVLDAAKFEKDWSLRRRHKEHNVAA